MKKYSILTYILIFSGSLLWADNTSVRNFSVGDFVRFNNYSQMAWTAGFLQGTGQIIELIQESEKAPQYLEQWNGFNFDPEYLRNRILMFYRHDPSIENADIYYICLVILESEYESKGKS